MKKFISVLFYFSVGFVLLGIGLKINYIPGGILVFVLGLLGLYIYFLARTIKDFALKRVNWLNLILQVLIFIMSVILFSKYLHHSFGDYIGLFIIPLFIVFAIIYLTSGKLRYTKLTVATALYLLFTIPLFRLNYLSNPVKYIPQYWYDSYNVDNSIGVTIPGHLKYEKTKELNAMANKLKNINNFNLAITFYRKALKIEPKNQNLLFNLSECYAKNDDLERSVKTLNKLILINHTYFVYYNNRGLLYYKLRENDKAIKDYKKAIQLDSNQPTLYANLALAFYEKGLYGKTCEAIDHAEKIGLKIDNYKTVKRIKNEVCK